MKKVLFLLGTILILFSSCRTLVPYTNQMKQQNGWNETQLRQIQFYNSHPIVLQRNLRSNETRIVSGRIKTVDGQQVEEIIIKRGTRGVVTAFPDSDRIAVSFEISDQYFLTFGVDNRKGGRYYLRLHDYKLGQYQRVTYSGQIYDLHPNGLNAFLQVNQKRINKLQKQLRVAGGRKL